MLDAQGSRLMIAGACLLGGMLLIGIPIASVQPAFFGGGILTGLAMLLLFVN